MGRTLTSLFTIVIALRALAAVADPGPAPATASPSPSSVSSELAPENALPSCIPSGSNRDQEIAQRGCCSWHDGVCGCSGGRVQCCDGSQSPSCGCFAESRAVKD